MTDLSFLSLKGLRGRWILQNLNCFAQLSGSWQRSDSFENRGATPEAKILNRLQMFRGDVFRNTVADSKLICANLTKRPQAYLVIGNVQGLDGITVMSLNSRRRVSMKIKMAATMLLCSAVILCSEVNAGGLIGQLQSSSRGIEAAATGTGVASDVTVGSPVAAAAPSTDGGCGCGETVVAPSMDSGCGCEAAAPDSGCGCNKPVRGLLSNLRGGCGCGNSGGGTKGLFQRMGGQGSGGCGCDAPAPAPAPAPVDCGCASEPAAAPSCGCQGGGGGGLLGRLGSGGGGGGLLGRLGSGCGGGGFGSPLKDCGCDSAPAAAPAPAADCGCESAPAAAPSCGCLGGGGGLLGRLGGGGGCGSAAAPAADCGCDSAPVADCGCDSAPVADCGCDSAPAAAPSCGCQGGGGGLLGGRSLGGCNSCGESSCNGGCGGGGLHGSRGGNRGVTLLNRLRGDRIVRDTSNCGRCMPACPMDGCDSGCGGCSTCGDAPVEYNYSPGSSTLEAVPAAPSQPSVPAAVPSSTEGSIVPSGSSSKARPKAQPVVDSAAFILRNQK